MTSYLNLTVPTMAAEVSSHSDGDVGIYHDLQGSVETAEPSVLDTFLGLVKMHMALHPDWHLAVTFSNDSLGELVKHDDAG